MLQAYSTGQVLAMPPPVDESTPPNAKVQRRSSLQELSRLMTAEEALLAAEASDLAQSRRGAGPRALSARGTGPHGDFEDRG